MTRLGRPEAHRPETCDRCRDRAKTRYAQIQKSIKTVLETAEGRRVLDFFLNLSGKNASKLWVPGAELSAVVARRDYGQEIEDEIFAADGYGAKLMREERYHEAELELAKQQEDERLMNRRER